MGCTIALAEELSRREERDLAPYAIRGARSRGRVHPEPDSPDRGVFHTDRDRIVWSRAFRRLQYKTQVLTNQEGDYYRTRLTHTLEVAQIARGIARSLRLNEDLVEAVALAHDLGHPPFGHAGEAALDELLRPHGGFEHNQQALRVVDLLERGYGQFPGLNLTFEVREAIALHAPAGSQAKAGFDAAAPSVEGQVVVLADSIAYDAHDLDDGLKAGLIAEEDLRRIALWRRAAEGAAHRTDGVPPRIRLLETIRALLDLQAGDLLETTARNLDGLPPGDGVRCLANGAGVVALSETMRGERKDLGDFLFERLYRHHQVMRMARKARRIVTDLYEELCRHPDQLPPEHRAWCDEVGVERGVGDYVAGMTDRYAQREYRQLFHPFERVLGP